MYAYTNVLLNVRHTHIHTCAGVCARVSTYMHATRVYAHVGARAWMSSYTHATHLYAHLHACACTHVPLHARYTHSLTHVGAHAQVCSYTHYTRIHPHLCRYVCTYAPLHAQRTQIHRPNRKTNRILAVNSTQTGPNRTPNLYSRHRGIYTGCTYLCTPHTSFFCMYTRIFPYKYP